MTPPPGGSLSNRLLKAPGVRTPLQSPVEGVGGLWRHGTAGSARPSAYHHLAPVPPALCGLNTNAGRVQLTGPARPVAC